MIVLIIMGPAGSGKGTVASMLSERLNIEHLSTGDMLRDIVKSQTELGKKVESIISKGSLVDNDTIEKIIDHKISQSSCKNGFILDGYPRNLQQAESLDRVFKVKKIEIYNVIELLVSEDILYKRITGRFICSSCNHIYNDYYAPPKKQNICDICGLSNFKRRDDDQDTEAIKKRLQIYNQMTSQAIEFYKNKNSVYIGVNGTLDKQELLSRIEKELLK